MCDAQLLVRSAPAVGHAHLASDSRTLPRRRQVKTTLTRASQRLRFCVASLKASPCVQSRLTRPPQKEESSEPAASTLRSRRRASVSRIGLAPTLDGVLWLRRNQSGRYWCAQYPVATRSSAARAAGG